jgi:hypothetical protein
MYILSDKFKVSSCTIQSHDNTKCDLKIFSPWIVTRDVADDAESQLLQLLLTINPGEEVFAVLDQALHLHSPLEEAVSEIVNGLEISNHEVIFYNKFS